MRIVKAELEHIEEPLKSAFAFKGQYSARPMWNTAVRLTSDSGLTATGVSNEGILWSDPAVYHRFSSTGGNAAMYLISDFACRAARGLFISRPDELTRTILPDVMAYGRAVTGLPALRTTFVLNALVALDTAVWLLWARERGLDFDGLIPEHARPYMSARHDSLAAVPLITYSATDEDILHEVSCGRFFLKIKIGSDPMHDGDPEKMLAWDCERLSRIHMLLRDIPCTHSADGHIPYYLDANGRYDSPERLMRLLEHADRIGMLPRIALLEEPFPESAGFDVSGFPVRIAADESAHTADDVCRRIEMGYRAVALKPIAKTMTMSFDMIAAAGRAGVPVFCADLTVPPAAVELNKSFAARLPALPGLDTGVLESNGHQYYLRWPEMLASLPCAHEDWVEPRQGLYTLNDRFYEHSAGLFEPIPLYENLF